MMDLSEEINLREKDKLTWLVASYPGQPSEVIAKYEAIRDAEKHAKSIDSAMDIVRKMKHGA